jgi:hypothetical protein
MVVSQHFTRSHFTRLSLPLPFGTHALLRLLLKLPIGCRA